MTAAGVLQGTGQARGPPRGPPAGPNRHLQGSLPHHASGAPDDRQAHRGRGGIAQLGPALCDTLRRRDRSSRPRPLRRAEHLTRAPASAARGRFDRVARRFTRHNAGSCAQKSAYSRSAGAGSCGPEPPRVTPACKKYVRVTSNPSSARICRSNQASAPGRRLSDQLNPVRSDLTPSSRIHRTAGSSRASSKWNHWQSSRSSVSSRNAGAPALAFRPFRFTGRAPPPAP